MKGVAFTLDGIFALVIAGAGVSVLVYFFYAGQTPYLLQTSQAGSVMSILSSAKIGTFTAVPFLSYISKQGAASNQTWPQYLKDAYGSGSNAYGPQKPSVAFVIDVSNAILNNSIVADYGNVYFSDGGVIYCYSNYGTQLWSKKATIPTVASLALYNGMLLYLDSGNLTALNAYNGTQIWKSSINTGGTVTTPLKIYQGIALFGAAHNNILWGIYANNGTTAWSLSTGSTVLNITAAQGSIVYVDGANLNLISMPGSGSPVAVWNYTVSGTVLHSGVSSSGNSIAFAPGDTNSANAISISNTIVGNYLIGSNVRGISLYKGTAYYHAVSNVTAMSVGGTKAWDKGIPSAYGSALQGSYPVESGTLVYTLGWTGSNMNLTAENLTNGTVMWSMKMPYSTRSNPGMVLAYGRLYLSVGSKIIAVGTCRGSPGTSLLASAATAYANGYTGCASAMLNSIRSEINYTMQIDRISSVNAATFDGASSYVEMKNPFQKASMTQGTIDVWVKFNTYGSNSNIVFDVWGQNLYPRITYTTSNNDINLEYWIDGAYHNLAYSGFSSKCPVNTWCNIVVTLNTGTGAKSYLNGKLIANDSYTGTSYNAGLKDMIIGYDSNLNYYMHGYISNVQVYNVSENSSAVQLMYREGQNGAPVDQLHIVGWWPLGGDTNDYSGANDTGFPFNIAYTNSNYSITSIQNAYQVSSSTIALPLLNYTGGKYITHNVSIVSWS
ncbi:MAG: PQQ-binding-like beta-propeller repeat protein [Candidatus Micrarchaeota archaeon]|nr:PQQ-binding-like beta-propeller repeat protein [Candidatus Micrarchaeota archaeon]